LEGVWGGFWAWGGLENADGENERIGRRQKPGFQEKTWFLVSKIVQAIYYWVVCLRGKNGEIVGAE
jgi:hypothetical protein